MAREGANIRFDGLFPSHFPRIRSLEVLPGGVLVVFLWSENPDQSRPFLYFDCHGNEIYVDVNPGALSHVFAKIGERYLVPVWDPEEMRSQLILLTTEQLNKHARG